MRDTIHRLLKSAIEVKKHRYLWTPADGINFVPRLCSKVFGDGRALLALTTINSRPRYYVIRIDSSWDVEDCDAPDGAPDLRDHLGDIECALEDEFGAARSYTDDEDCDLTDEEVEAATAWPTFDGDLGTSWSRIDWPALRGVRMVPHPFAQGYNALAPVKAERAEQRARRRVRTGQRKRRGW